MLSADVPPAARNDPAGQFAEAGGSLLECRDLDDASAIVLECALRITESAAGFAGFLDPATGSLVCRSVAESGETPPDLGAWWPGEHSAPLLSNSPSGRTGGSGRFLSVPVVQGKRTLGHIAVFAAARDYTAEDLAWVERLGWLHGAAIRRIRRDEAERQTRVRLQAAFEAAPVGIAALDTEGRIAMWNSGAERIFGWKEEEVLGRVPPTVPEDRLEEVNAVYRDLLARGERVDYELRRHRKDGATVDLAVSMAPIRDQAGALSGMVAVYSDITARKEAERLLLRANQELSRSNAELEQFAYVASHDLQEPLRMIKGYLQLLHQRYAGKLDQDATDFIGFAVDGATRMNSLIDALLQYSRVGSRGREFALCQSAAALDRALSNLTIAIAESGAEIEKGALPEITGDVVQLAQVFQNLIGNAIKFRGGRTPHVCVGAEHREDEWLFWVRDNGIGIPPEQSERIFEIFQRLHSREEYEGTGIGLAISKRIVERHGGRIWVESAPGEGSTFFFTIPDGR